MDILQSHETLNTWAKRFKAGDAKAAEELFNYFYPKIYRYVRSRLFDKDSAADVTQDIFLKLTRVISSFDEDKGNVNAWLWQIVATTLTDHFRKVGRTPTNSESSLDISLDDFSKDDTSGYSRIEVQEIMAVIKTFPEEEQELFRLRFIAELSYEEIAALTKRNENALRVAIYRIKDKLQKKYDRKT